MMDKNEIKANYLDIYTDLFKLLEHFERVQKPTNDVVGKFFGTALVAGMTLNEISDAVNKQKLTSEIIDKFFEDSKTQDITMKFSDLNRYISDQKRLGIKNLLVSFFFSKRNERMMTFNEIGVGMTLTEISEFIDKHTHDGQVANNFFRVPVTSKTALSDIDMFMAKQMTLSDIVDKFFLENTSDGPNPC